MKRHILRISVVLCALAVVGVGCTGIVTGQSRRDMMGGLPGTDVSSEEYSVLSALISAMYVRMHIKRIVIEKQIANPVMLAFEWVLVPLEEELELSKSDDSGVIMLRRYVAALRKDMCERMPNVDQEAIDDFCAKSGLTFRESFNLDLPYILAGDNDHPGWTDFYKKYPNSQGWLTLSRVGFNSAKNLAVVYAGNLQGPKFGYGYYVVLEKVNGTWQIKDKYKIWVS